MKTKQIEDLETAIATIKAGVVALAPFVNSLESPILYVEAREVEKNFVPLVERLQELKRVCARSIRCESR